MKTRNIQPPMTNPANSLTPDSMKKRMIYTCLFNLFSLILWSQPTADFTVDVTQVCPNASVTFSNNSTGTGLSFLWDFYDGSTSTVQNPTHVYSNSAVYDVCLYVTDDMGLMDTLCQPGLITVFDIPTSTANFSFCENEGCFTYPGDNECYEAGTYTINLAGASYLGCDSIVMLNVMALPSFTTTLSETICEGEFIVFGGITYFDAGIYSETFISSTGCDSVVMLDITVLPSNFLRDDLLCSGESITVNGTIYDETNPAGVEGMISIYGCDSIVTINLSFVPVGEIGIADVEIVNTSCNGVSDASICINEMICGQAPYTYTWSNGATGNCISNLIAGQYSVTVSDANSITLEEFFTIAEPDLLQVSNINTTNVTCGNGNDGAVDITVSGGVPPYTFEPENFTDLEAGNYTFTITDASGCQLVTAPIVINEPTPMILSIIVNDATCGNNDGSITLAVSGGTPPYLYNWNDGLYFIQDPTGLFPGIYTVEVTDANGCTAEDIAIIGQDGGPDLTATSTDASCFGGNDGSIDLTVINGTAPFTYLWNNGTITEDLTNVEAGDYTVTVTDADGCNSSLTEIVSSPSAIDILTNVTNASCNNADGSIDITVTGGTSPYAYLWSNGSSLLNLMNLSQGVYTITVTDSNGCTAVTTANVLEGLVLSANATDVSCNGANDGAIDLMVNNGTAPYEYVWSNGATTEDLTGLAAGAYNVTVTDSGLCTAVLSVFILENSPILISIFGPSEICEGESLTLCPLPIGGIVTYLWTGPNGFVSTEECIEFLNISPAEEGCYNLIVTDTNGCTSEVDFCFTVAPETLLTVSADATICAGESITLSVVPSGNLSDYTFDWTPVSTIDDPTIPNAIVSPMTTTTYNISVYDINTGCTTSDFVTVSVIEDCVWPGDTDTNKVVNNYDLLNIGLAYDSVGPSRPGANILWTGQEAPDWTQSITAGPNYKHIDCDGNGLIDVNDTLAITGNWGEMHNFTGTPIQQYVHNYPIADGFLINAPFYVQADTLIEGAMMSLPIILGEEANAAEEVYGIAYSLTYDTAYIEEGSVSIGFGNSWLGVNNNNMITVQRNFPSEGRIDIAMTRIDGNNITDYGQLAQLFITVEDDILFAPEDGSGIEFRVENAVFNITNVLVINNLGEEIPVIPTETSAPVGTTTSTHNITLAEAIQVFPNPAKDRIWVTTKNTALQNIRLYNLNGELIRWTTEPTLDVQQVSTGLYLLKVQTEAGVHVEKVMVNY